MERRERSLRGPNATTASSSGNSTGLLSVATSLPALTPAQMYNNFEEWIKMCTDNVRFFFSFLSPESRY
jgi:condensin complex subunit 2